MLAASVQPLADVTVTVYVPGAVMESPVDVPTTLVPLDHEYVPPPVAVTLIDVVPQVRTVVPELLMMAAVGVVIFCVIVMLASSVQPLAEVTVTVYVPGVAMERPAEVPTSVVPLDHE